MFRRAINAFPVLAAVMAAPSTMSAMAHDCTQPPVWYWQAAGLTRTLLLAEGGYEAMLPADFFISAGDLSPYGVDTSITLGTGATGFLVRAVDVAGVDSAAAREALGASRGRMVVVPFPDYGCSAITDSIRRSHAISATLPVAEWWPSAGGKVVILATLRPRSKWVNQLPTFNVFVGASAMPYGPSLVRRLEYPFKERKAISITAESLFDFLRVIPLYSTFPCSAPRGLESLRAWEVANPTLVKSQPMKDLFKEARGTLKSERGAARNKKKCPAPQAS